MLGQIDYARTRIAAERIFGERATHVFPPSATLPAEWQRELENMAQERGYRTTNAEGIEAEFTAVLQAIATSKEKSRFHHVPGSWGITRNSEAVRVIRVLGLPTTAPHASTRTSRFGSSIFHPAVAKTYASAPSRELFSLQAYPNFPDW
jgi:hypothetical protein